MLKKNPWIVGVSLAALTLAPVLQAAETAKSADSKKSAAPAAKAEPEAKSDVKPEKAATAKTDPTDKLDKKDKASKAAPAVSHKSPALAGFLGFIPGIAVHGAGHMYAGSWMKGLGLLAIEGVTIGVMANTISSGTDDIQKLSKGLDNGKFPTDVSAAYAKTGILLVGTMAFLWSWWDDMAGAPIAAKEYNRLADEESQSTALRLEPRLDGIKVALSTNF